MLQRGSGKIVVTNRDQWSSIVLIAISALGPAARPRPLGLTERKISEKCSSEVDGRMLNDMV
jgi:hypothetical protein